ncbi:type I-B CRISPR-associated protein Cas8b1/Cst1 [Ligilactobacillus agilis]|uniref:type I-B CRISPR-associated protein Cas8b1/Cst1 n=1 Tax=Ligilactobacillus agilis TaxID=1601 RepID=UPI0014375865|nr:type I-B CRISPR-associated protein Cas8b1/Cst1 [Ligilactobacillus agilis]GET10146.1 CRISPR-associated CXXC_CXXC protein Cst1 [Ligilactobacillus agilis]
MQGSVGNEPKIRFESQGDWLENAGIVGLARILGKDCYSIEGNSLLVKMEALNNFAQNYFKFFINEYGRQTRLVRITNEGAAKKLAKWQALDVDAVDPKVIYNQLENWYKNYLKYYVDSGSFKKISSLAPPAFDVKATLKECSQELKNLKKLQKNKQEFNEALQQLVGKLLNFTNYFQHTKFNKLDLKDYFMAKTLSYVVINNAWSGISFLNPQAKTADLYQDYEDTFVKPVIEYLKVDHQKDVYQCAACGRPLKKQEYSYSFLNGLGYDVNRKTSNAWLFNNDQFMCPICRLMYTAVSAGFNYNMQHQGIFINQNQDIATLISVNGKVLTELERAVERKQLVSPWRAFAQSFQEMFVDSSKYSLADIQVVNYQDGQYSFNLVPKRIANVLKKANDKQAFISSSGQVFTLLSALNSAYIKNFHGQSSASLYEEMLKRLLISMNLNSLISDTLQLKIVRNPDLHINVYQIYNLIQINLLYFKEMSDLALTDEELKKMRGSGKNLGEGYDNENKRQSLAYQLLQALKTQNNDQFMNLLLNAYLYQKKLVPKNFIRKMSSQEEFNQLGYAFIAGLIPNIEKPKEEK